MSEDTFERIQKYAELDDDEREAYEAFMDVTCESAPSMEAFRKRYCGRWDSEEAFAQHLADELCMFDNVPESITRFFGLWPSSFATRQSPNKFGSALAAPSGDFKAFAHELLMSDYDFSDGHVFRTC